MKFSSKPREIPKIRTIFCNVAGSIHDLQPFHSQKKLEEYFRTLPTRSFPLGGEAFDVHFSNGVYVCTAEIVQKTEAEKPEFIRLVSCKLKTSKLKITPIHFQDIMFPGKEKITAFLVLHLTGNYKIGTVFEICFSDGVYMCTLGISSCEKRENNVRVLTPGIPGTIAHILEETLKT